MIAKNRFFGMVLAALCMVTVAGARHASPAAFAVGSDKTAQSERILAPYLALNSYQATIRSTTVLQPVNGSKPNVIDGTVDVAYKAPNLFRVDMKGLLGGGLRISDGTSLYTYSALTNQYSVETAPKYPLRELMAQVGDAVNLLPRGQVLIDGQAAREYDGTTAAVGAGARIQVFVNTRSGLLERIVISEKSLPGPRGANFHLTMTEDYVAQRLNPSLAPNLFRFVAPDGAQESPAGQIPLNMGPPN